MNFYVGFVDLVALIGMFIWCARLSYRRGVRDGRFKTNCWWVAVGHDIEAQVRSQRSEQIE